MTASGSADSARAGKGPQMLGAAGAILGSSCAVGIALIPLGLGSVMASAAFKFLDDYRFVFMAIALITLAAAHWSARRSGQGASRFLWLVTILAVVFMGAELIVDPPWDRHALVPM